MQDIDPDNFDTQGEIESDNAKETKEQLQEILKNLFDTNYDPTKKAQKKIIVALKRSAIDTIDQLCAYGQQDEIKTLCNLSFPSKKIKSINAPI